MNQYYFHIIFFFKILLASPPIIEFGSLKLFVRRVLYAITELSGILTPFKIWTWAPIQTLSPIITFLGLFVTSLFSIISCPSTSLILTFQPIKLLSPNLINLLLAKKQKELQWKFSPKSIVPPLSTLIEIPFEKFASPLNITLLFSSILRYPPPLVKSSPSRIPSLPSPHPYFIKNLFLSIGISIHPL